MEFNNVIKDRHSVRNFSAAPVTTKQIDRIMSVVATAPSAGNLKAYKVISITDKHVKQELVDKASVNSFILEAPLLLTFFALPDVSSKEYDQRGSDLYCIQDATIACSYAQLAATDLGLGSCWIGHFDELKVNEIINKESNHRPVALLPVGYEA